MGKELKRFSRKELLELLLEVIKENEELKEKNSIAEVGIKITGLFDVIEEAATKYLKENGVSSKEEERANN